MLRRVSFTSKTFIHSNFPYLSSNSNENVHLKIDTLHHDVLPILEKMDPQGDLREKDIKDAPMQVDGPQCVIMATRLIPHTESHSSETSGELHKPSANFAMFISHLHQ